jgi:hypothetical protein
MDGDARRAVFHSFWKIDDTTKQKEFIARHTEKTQVKRRRIRGKPRSDNSDQHYKRSSTIKYFFTSGGDKIKVCLTFFLATLDVSHKVVKNAVKGESPEGIVQSDQRGKGSNPRKTPENILEGIRNHIASFEAIPSHYCRKESKRTYLPSHLNITEMYRLYKEESANKGNPASSFTIYRTVFCDEFNISFHIPKKDACSVCEGSKNASPEQEQQEEAFNQHMRNKDEARDLKEELKMKAKKSETFYTGCFDLQQVLQCPYGQNNLFYYKRKLDVYNLSIYSLGDGAAHCYMWDEREAKRGANEVACSGICRKSLEQGKLKWPYSLIIAPGKIKIGTSWPCSCML